MLTLLAVLTMVVDHIGFLFFPEQEWMRAIGRLSMPTFSYAIARGYYYTKDKNRYLERVGILALLSQLPFTLLFGLGKSFSVVGVDLWIPTLNMVFPWFLALVFLRMRFIYVIPLIFLLFYIPMDYTSLVTLLPIVIYHFWFKIRRSWVAGSLSLAVLVILSLMSSPVQWWSLLTVPMIVALEPYDDKIKLKRWFSYPFYPAHMTLLLFICLMFGISTPFFS